MVAQSGGEVNRLLDRRLVQRLPAIDAAHGDLARGHQGPEQHGRRFRVGQRALGLHPALELPVQAFDGVGGAQVTSSGGQVNCSTVKRCRTIALFTCRPTLARSLAPGYGASREL